MTSDHKDYLNRIIDERKAAEEEKRIKNAGRNMAAGVVLSVLAGVALHYFACRDGPKIEMPKPVQKISLDGLLNGAPKGVIQKVYEFKDANEDAIRIDNYVKRHPNWFQRLVNLGNSAAGLEGEFMVSQQDLAAALGAESRLKGKNKGQLTKPAYDEMARMIPEKITEKKKEKVIVKKNHRYNPQIAELFGNRVPSLDRARTDEETNLYVCGAYLISLVPKYTSTENNPTKIDPRKCAIWEYNWGNDIRDIVKNGKSAADIYWKVSRLKRDGVATAFQEGIRYDAIRKNGQEAIQQRKDSPASAHSSQTGASAQTQRRL